MADKQEPRKSRSRKEIKDTCSDCDKIVTSTDDALCCSVCDEWYHIKCQRVPKSDYDLLQKSDDSIQWFCKSCKGASQKIFKMLTLVHRRQDKMDSELKVVAMDIKKCNDKLDTQVQAVKNVVQCVSDLDKKLPDMISNQINEILDDRQEIKSREKNIMFFNLPDTGSTEDDKDVVHSICRDVLGVTGVLAEDFTRIGETITERRPLRVSIENRETRGQILKNAFKLKNSLTYSKIGIGRDLTKKQRLASKDLRKKLEKLKREEPEKNWAIRRDKLVELPKQESSSDRGARVGHVPPGRRPAGDVRV